ncbi:TrpB-like pyridoxal phosphate-dependent enzyme [Ferviditalea candida]|uniref:Tryptophan synthase beta chain n=1 Tax=Ferviditalea candida TaxID=3108399 RepID=A0ABU5ZGR3_9BACL|nr:TrpB-like pyridoxal phosphate-dependent enzyme [Paenibacillaceae bacterium T2]
MSEKKILLSEKEIPTHWYNVMKDMPNPLKPPINPGTGKPAGPEDFSAIFPQALIAQEMSGDRWVEIPDEVRELYKIWRPTPMFRAYQLEKALGTPAHIYYKYEGVSPAGSHKLNTAIPQAYYNKKEGIKRLATETGAGQWGSSLSMACKFFDLECAVYMVKVSYNQKPYRRILMNSFGAEVIPSPSDRTESGRAVLAQNPDSPGSLGVAISEAVEDAAKRGDTNYALGSVLNHVILHQTVIGQEALLQMEKVGEYPDVIFGSCGGGSNFAGLAFPFLHQNLTAGKKTRLVAVEPEACPTLTRGKFAYDFGDVAQLTPIMMMYTLGHDFMPPGIHAGGLRYHGDSPLVSQLYHDGLIEAEACGQTDVFKAALQFAQTEGIIPAPESAHAVSSAINEALRAKESGEKRVILFNLSGHGHFDMSAYESYLSGNLQDIQYDEDALKQSLERLPQVT